MPSVTLFSSTAFSEEDIILIIINNDKSKSKLKKALIDPKTKTVSNLIFPLLVLSTRSLIVTRRNPTIDTVSLDSDNDKDGSRPVELFAADPGTSPVTLANWYSRPSTFPSTVSFTFSSFVIKLVRRQCNTVSSRRLIVRSP